MRHAYAWADGRVAPRAHRARVFAGKHGRRRRSTACAHDSSVYDCNFSSPRRVRHRLITMRPVTWIPLACKRPYSSSCRSAAPGRRSSLEISRNNPMLSTAARSARYPRDEPWISKPAMTSGSKERTVINPEATRLIVECVNVEVLRRAILGPNPKSIRTSHPLRHALLGRYSAPVGVSLKNQRNAVCGNAAMVENRSNHKNGIVPRIW